MTSTRLVGLIGGLGPAATILYYMLFLSECRLRNTEPELIVAHANVEKVLAAAALNDPSKVADVITPSLRRLETAGADVLAIAAVTPHMCISEIKSAVRTPIVDLVDVVKSALREMGTREVVLLGTRSTLQSRFFGELGVPVVEPTAAEIEEIHGLYVSIVREGAASQQVADGLSRCAHSMAARANGATVVLAGTELSLVQQDAWDGLKVVDCAALHVSAIVQAAGDFGAE